MECFDPRRVPADWTPDQVALLEAIDDATSTPVLISYRLATEWAGGVFAVLADIGAVADAEPRVAVELIEHALARLDRANIDDADGWLTQLAGELAKMHTDISVRAGCSSSEIAARRERLQRLELRPFDPIEEIDALPESYGQADREWEEDSDTDGWNAALADGLD